MLSPVVTLFASDWRVYPLEYNLCNVTGYNKVRGMGLITMEHPENEDRLLDMAEEDMEEGMDRMQDEGGGVVEQHLPAGAPVLRNDLVLPPDDADYDIPGAQG